MLKRFLTIVLALLAFGVQAFSQTAVSGKVTDSQGEAVVGASVFVKGTSLGTMTTPDGAYSLTNVPANATLVFSCIGFANQEVAVSSRKVINVILKEDAEFLDDVVVVAYGTARKRDLTGALTSVNGDMIATQSQSTVTRALEGSVPGLQIAGVDGQPGVDVGIRVRGISTASQNNANALVVIDGVPAPADVTISPLASINPADIESISVLKDAASTALYGSRGANGVVLVTTKRGREGKVRIDFEARAGFNILGPAGRVNSLGAKNPGQFYETEWLAIRNEAEYTLGYSAADAAEFASQHLFNYAGYTKDDSGNMNPVYRRNNLHNYLLYEVPGATFTPDGTADNHSSTMTGAYLVNTDGKLNPKAKLLYSGNDYVKELTTPAFRQEYKLSASGGSKKMDYHMSLGYLSDPSYISWSKFERFNVRSNVNAQITNWLKVGVNMAYARRYTASQTTRWGRNPGLGIQNIAESINFASPLDQMYARDLNGNYKRDANGNKITHLGTTSADAATMTDSPLGMTKPWIYDLKKVMEQSEDSVIANDLNMRGYAEVKIIDGLKFTTNMSVDQYWTLRTRYYQRESANGWLGSNPTWGDAIWKQRTEYQYIDTQQLLTYDKDFGGHHIDAMVGHEFYQYKQDYMRWGSGDTLIPGYKGYSNFLGLHTYGTFGSTSGGGNDLQRLESYLSRLNYVYNNKYYLSASFRRDGSSKFKKPENRWGNFWSIGGGWRISSEDFMAATRNWLDNLKVRASYGVIGNQNGISSFSGYQTWSYSATSWVLNGLQTKPAGYKLSMGTIINDSLTWENTNTFDAGLDLNLFKNRLAITFDFYNRQTTNAVWAAPAAISKAGQISLQQNTAGIRNRGIELELDLKIYKDSNWDINFSTNGTAYNTILTDVPSSQYDPEVLNGCWTAGADGWSMAGGGSDGGAGFLRGIGKPYYNLFYRRYGGVAGNPGLTYYSAVGSLSQDGAAKDKQNHTIASKYIQNAPEMRGQALYWHTVTAAEAEATGLPVGKDILVTSSSFKADGKSISTAGGVGLADCYELGDAVPDWIGGFTFSARYKNFDFSTQFAYQLGGKVVSISYGGNEAGLYNVIGSLRTTSDDSSGGFRRGAVSQEVYRNTWTEDNTGAKFPMIQFSDNTNAGIGATSGTNYSDIGIFNASYLSLKNITLGYTVPAKLLNKIRVSALRVFATADNIAFFYPHSGVDPRMSLTGLGVGAGAYAYPATYNLGVNISF